MNKNTLLAFGLSALVLIGFQIFFAPKPQPAATTPESQTSAVSDAQSQPAVKLEMEKAPQAVEKLETFDITTDLATYTFNANTGNIRKAVVTKYGKRDLENIVFDSKTEDSFFITVPLVSKYTAEVKEGDKETTVTFSGSQGDMVVAKKYVISKDSYLVKGDVTVSNTGGRTLNLPLRMGLAGGINSALKEDKYTFGGPQMFDGKKLREKKVSKIDEPVKAEKPLWVGYTSKYFLAAVANGFDKGEIVKKDDVADVYGDTEVQVNPSDRKTVEFSVFAGPKEYDLLKTYKLKLEKSIDFGIFSFIAIPMLKFLKIFYNYVHNYGVAIVLLTIVVKLLTFPLTQKSMVSMKKMGSLAPKMAEIKEKYKADKEKMNQATMELYKKEGVNPFGGCFPMLLQIPIFFALYKTLLLSIELQGAPFFGWITDLSLKDPYYITPIIMGVTMFLQQKMSPSTVQDPIQQKMFMLMPVIFTFMFLTFPAGLVVYWLTNNVLSIAQQYYINKKHG